MNSIVRINVQEHDCNYMHYQLTVTYPTPLIDDSAHPWIIV